MALIHTRTGQTLPGCGLGSECTRSSLSQAFNVSSILTISGKGALLSNEFPTFTSTNSAFNDRYLVSLRDSAGTVFNLFDFRVKEVDFSPSKGGSGAGFTLNQGGGQTSFDTGTKTVVAAKGTATLTISVSNVSDSALDSAFIIDAVSVLQDPPLFF